MTRTKAYRAQSKIKNPDTCTSHYIGERTLTNLVLESMRRVFLNIQAFEKEFVRKQLESYDADKKKELTAKRRELEKAKKRIAEIDKLIQRIYEDNVIGKRYQIIDIYYNGVGIIKPLNPEDMEAGFQRHMAKKQQKQKKTA